MPRNGYFEAVEAKRLEDADRFFGGLVAQILQFNTDLTLEDAQEKVVANLMYAAGYYDEETRKRAGRLYGHRSVYRRKLKGAQSG